MAVKTFDTLPESISIRKAVAEDIEAMWKIDQVCFDPGIAYSVDIFYYHLLITNDSAFVVESEGNPIGFVMASKAGRTKGQIVTIDILPEWRRRGIGSRLITMCEESQKKKGLKSMELQVETTNEPAIAFYKKQGYKQGKLLTDYYSPGRNAYLFSRKIA